MNHCNVCGQQHNIGFVATRLAGTDGVSLETAKWADFFEKQGCNCFFFAGELDRPKDRSYLVKEAHFRHPEIRKIFKKCFGVVKRERQITQMIYAAKEKLKDELYKFIEQFQIELLIPENSLTIPLNIPLGIAITEVISETGIPTIAHHHDFFWERQHFLTNAVWEYLNMAFPPHLSSMRHVVINSSADNQLSLRTGISATIIPNVMDFENPPPPVDAYASDVRETFGFEEDELFILQPTRVVQRKGIEHAIEIVHRLGKKAKLIISHASGDEGYDYEKRVKEYSKLMKVDTIFASKIINEKRGRTKQGKKIYTLEDVYPHADLVTYPSTFEGFGNAFLEAVYFRKPIVVNNYSIYSFDIQPKGFSVIEIDGFVSEDAVRLARKVLENPGFRKKMVDKNYEIAQRFFSYRVLHQKLKNIVSDCIGCSPGK
ncbi:MAG: glycosyltransferase family 4 protein [Pseudomonadota bacterium]|uniref:Glycosyltransferase family 4 protein n=1 Tax=Candidatus Desulfatibia profunda TaxID=2841695 RepID=A0A8J6TGY5_9BACT|nr:glycosyltransferase family 4 protein [Candidatus Desulfatibia profunda]MBL7181007.1 glycosyltransferase family 4 protein [Desulfobacterales bacterium]MBU0698495.1 glycosyltransferase family 4 protein [Pseudomonadota bacterium]